MRADMQEMRMDRPLSASRLLRHVPNFSIKTRVALMVAALVFMATLVVSMASLLFVRQSMSELVHGQVSDMLARTADDIDQNLLARRAALSALAVDLSKMVANDQATLQSLFDQEAPLANMFGAVLVLNEHGEILFRHGKLTESGEHFRELLHQVDFPSVAQQATLLSLRRDDGNHVALMTQPISGEHWALNLIVVGAIDFRDDVFFSQISNLKIGRSGYFYLINRDGLMLLHPQLGVGHQNTASNQLPRDARLSNTLLGSAHVTGGANDDDPVLFPRRLSGIDWTLWASYQEEDMLSPFARGLQRVTIAALLFALLTGVIAWAIMQRQILPLQRLRERIQRTRDDPTQLALHQTYRNDEFGMLETSFDTLVKDRLLAEAQMQAMEAELHAAVDCSLDAFAIMKPEYNAQGEITNLRFTYMNVNAAALFGMERHAAMAARLLDILPDARRNGWFDRLVSVMVTQNSMQNEFEVDTPVIHAKWLHYQIIPLEGGVAVTMRDISERKADEADMREKRAFLQSLIEYLPILIFAKSFKGETADSLVVWNKTAEHVMGYAAEQVIGKSNKEIFPSKVADTLNALDRQMLADPRVVVIPEFPYRRPDGALRYLHSISVPLFGETGKVDYILGIVEDITVRRAQEWTLRNQKAEMEAVNEALPLGLFRTDADGNVIYINHAFEKMTGLDLDEVRHHGWVRAVHPDDRDAAVEEWNAAIQNNLPYQSSQRFQHRDGRILWISLKAAQIKLDGKIRGYVGSVDDVTARRLAEEAVVKGERWLRTITDNLPALIAYIDADERYRFCNIHYERELNRRGGNMLGRRIADVVGRDSYAYSPQRIAAALRGENVRFERESVDDDGESHYWRVEYIPDIQGDVVAGFYSMVLDITELKQVENRLRNLARTDSLTGLANRSYFTETLIEAIKRSDLDESLLAVLFLDIDQFKAFNDSFGHLGGDTVLREFSRRLGSCIRHTDMVARLAGDEFVILLEAMKSSEEMEIVAKKIIREMERDFDVLGNPCHVTTSVGITIRRSGENDIETLLRRADDALYAAKAAGRNRYKIIW
jgi:diguanylate cyclase (GGDEF)-like protein/PAS domain S-box-containing protein